MMSLYFHRLAFFILTLFAAGIVTGCAYIRNPDLYPQIRRADKTYQKQQYEQAGALYKKLLEPRRRVPPAHRERILFQVGLCFYNDRFRALDAARDAFSNYLEKYPNGDYADEARRNLERIEAVAYNRRKAVAERREQATASAEELRKLAREKPYDADLQLRLGNALWELQRYEEACEAYLKSTEINAWLRDHELIQARLAVDENGDVVPNTDERRRQTERERNPLVFFDLNDFRSRPTDEFLSASEAFYNVTGMVRNQSSRYLRGVTIEVRFLNPTRKILDVRRYRIGTMPPGDIRGFSVTTSNFDSIFNINGYECVAYED